MWSLRGNFSTHNGRLPHASLTLHGVPLPTSRSQGETHGGEGARVCIVPLQGWRCYTPHSAQDPGVRSRGGQEAPVSVSALTRPQTCPGSPRSMHVTGLPPPRPSLQERTPWSRHRTHQGARLSLSKLLYVFPGGKRPRAVLEQICGQVPNDAGSRVHCVS